MIRICKIACLNAVALLLMAANVQAQGTATGAPPQQGTTKPGATAPGTGTATTAQEDPLIAACLLIGGRKQIENCTYAKDKVTNEEVKKFAQAEIEEHVKMKATLKQMGFEYPVPMAERGQGDNKSGTSSQQGSTNQTGTNAQTGSTNQQGTAAATGQVGNAGSIMLNGKAVSSDAASLIRLDHEVAETCIKNFRTEMDKHSGLKADKYFVNNQLEVHMVLKDKVETFRRHASKTLQPTLDESLQVIETHIAACKAMREKLEGMKDDKSGK